MGVEVRLIFNGRVEIGFKVIEGDISIVTVDVGADVTVFVETGVGVDFGVLVIVEVELGWKMVVGEAMTA